MLDKEAEILEADNITDRPLNWHAKTLASRK